MDKGINSWDGSEKPGDKHIWRKEDRKRKKEIGKRKRN